MRSLVPSTWVVLFLTLAGCEPELVDDSADACVQATPVWERFMGSLGCAPTDHYTGAMLIASQADCDLQCAGVAPEGLDFDRHALLAVYLDSGSASACASRATLVTDVQADGCGLRVSYSSDPDFDVEGACLTLVQPVDWIVIERPAPLEFVELEVELQ